MKANVLKALNVNLLVCIVGGTICVGAIVHYRSMSQMNSSTGAYSTTASQAQNMTTGTWDVAQMALQIAQHITGANLDQYDPADPGLQNVITYWKKLCGGICADAQPTSLQCAMYVSTVYGIAGHPLPKTFNAVDYWNGYQNQPGWHGHQNQPGWQEIQVKSGLPKVGDLIVWSGGATSAQYPNGIGHIAIVVDVQPPGGTTNATPPPAQSTAGGANTNTTTVQPPRGNTNGSVTVAQANDLKGGLVGGNDQIGYNLVTPDPKVPAITMPGVHLYQMPLLPDLTVRTWPNYAILGYIRNPSLVQNIGTSMASGYALAGQPTITADKINAILETNHSPAVGTGLAMYNLGVKYGIDPVFALAFFQHESSFGTQGVASITHALGNERCIADRPCVDSTGNLLSSGQSGYARMTSWEDGYDHWYALITGSTYAGSGLKTVDQIIPVYAPAADNNNEPAYIAAIKQAVDGWRSMK